MTGAVLLALLSALVPALLPAQQEARPRLEGQVVMGEEPFPEVTVVLHRVGPDESGELDSVASDAEGRFGFDLPTVPDPGGRGDIYFASVRYRDILYFGPAIQQAVQLDSAYTIQVYDTASAPAGGATLPVVIRYLIAEEAEGGWRVTDLLRVLNDGERTLVSRGGDPVWEYPLPPGAHSFELGTGDVPPEQAVYQGGAFTVTAPMPPGERQFMVRYVVDDLYFTLPAPGATAQLELLVREPAPELQVDGLTAHGPVEIEPGTTYRRFTGTDLRDATLVLEAGSPFQAPPTGVLAVVLALILAAAGTWAFLRGRPVPAGPGRAQDPGAGSDRRQALIVEVARLDDEMEATEDPELRTRLQERRARLVRALQDLS